MKIKYRNIVDDFIGLVLIALSLLLFISFLSKEPLSARLNLAGGFGVILYKLFFIPLGKSAFLLPLIFMVLGIKKLIKLEINWLMSCTGAIILIFSFSILLYLLLEAKEFELNFIGRVLAELFIKKFKLATYIILGLSIIIGLSLFTETSPFGILGFIKRTLSVLFLLLKYPIIILNIIIREKQKVFKRFIHKKKLSQKTYPTQEKYNLPEISLLKNHTKVFKPDTSNNEKAKLIEETLSDFGITAKVENVLKGPNVSNFEVALKRGTKVQAVLNLSDDLALALAVPAIRIHAPVPGKSLIGIEVPNRKIEIVSLKDVLSSDNFQKAQGLAIGLGKNTKGEPFIIDLSALPHLLISGATGSGKTICIHTIITSLLYKHTPEKLRFLLIDPKIVELTVYNGIPHLIGNVITEPKLAVLVLSNLQKLMENRYKLFAACKVKDIKDYNNKQQPIPYIVVIIDELADLMMTSMRECEDAIVRIAQLGRACGIHLVLATQRPSVDIITGMIKANILARIALAVVSKVDSRIILDQIGAEKLLGNGDMLYLAPTQLKPVRLQGSFISNHEIEGLVKYLSQQKVEFKNVEDYKFLFERKKDIDIEDDLYEDAIKVATQEKDRISISLLQRRLRIGYNRAARLYEQLQQKGII
jgi:S-DNA-T family DNA segregation ATPase FtsK/SpoIIIE